MTETDNLRKRVASLSEQNRDLHDRIASIEDALQSEVDAWLLTGLTQTERQVLAFLVKKGKASKTAIHQYVYSLDPQGGAEIKIIDVMVCKLRKKLPANVEILTIWGVGYEIPPASLEILRRAPA